MTQEKTADLDSKRVVTGMIYLILAFLLISGLTSLVIPVLGGIAVGVVGLLCIFPIAFNPTFTPFFIRFSQAAEALNIRIVNETRRKNPEKKISCLPPGYAFAYICFIAAGVGTVVGTALGSGIHFWLA